MTEWVIGIVCVVCLGVLLDIMLPEGETNKYIKGIFSVATIAVIVAPLPKLFSQSFSLDSLFGDAPSIESDQNYIDKRNENIKMAKLNDLVKILDKSGYKGVKTSISYNVDTNEISRVVIDCSGCETKVIDAQQKAEIKQITAANLKIDSDIISLSGFA